MFKKLLAVICALTLVSACSSMKEDEIKGGVDLYGNAEGGWDPNVDITTLQNTPYTDAFNAEVTPVVYFKLDSSELCEKGQSVLAQQAEWLQKNPRALIVIEGNCDERGTTEYNLALGERRANAARRYLIANGVADNRIRTLSNGKEKPVALGSNEEAWAQNRNATTKAY